MNYIASLKRACVNTEQQILSVIETFKILNDKETLKDIEEGLQDIKNGKVIGFEDFLRKYGYEK